MTRRVMQCAALTGWLILCPAMGQAQEPAGAMSLRVQWEADVPRNGLQAVCGHVFNDRPMSAVRVRLRVEGLDGQGGVTGRREADVLGSVPSGGNTLYCITMFAGAATYRVTVIGADWTAGSDGP